MDDVSEDHRLRADKLLKATSIDPVAKIVFTVTALLLMYLIFDNEYIKYYRGEI